MSANSTPYEILVGVGTLYVAPALTAAPDVDSVPGEAWRNLGETDGGVKVTKTRSLEYHGTDQRTGKVKATLNEEGLEIETNLTANTLENLADLLALTVTDAPPGAATIGTRKVGLYSGDVKEFALLFTGKSPYGDYPAMYYVPRGVFDSDLQQEFTKEGKTLVPAKFMALEDLTAVTENERFGYLIVQDAAATG